MLYYLTLAFFALFAYKLFSLNRSWNANIAACKQSGLHYIVTPVFYYSAITTIVHALALAVCRPLPKRWTTPWLTLLEPNWVWEAGYAPFAEYGDAFLIASPTHITLWTADAEANHQITSRRNDFPKHTAVYKVLDVYGSSLISSEGAVGRHHRKITSVPFSEKNNLLVWQESLRQGKSMLTHWTGPKMGDSDQFDDIDHACKSLTLHIISKAGFDIGLDWPHEREGKVDQIPKGHTMTYEHSLHDVLDYLYVVLLTPSWLRWLPFEGIRRATESYNNWGQYMKETVDSRKAEVRSGGKAREGLDLAGALVKGAGITAETQTEAANGKSSKSPSGQLLTDDEIYGNLFLFILAGHETTANTFHYSLIYLATNPGAQRRMQADLDSIFGNRPESEWDYDTDVSKLAGSMVGAVMNEQLRLIPPVQGIPKCTLPGRPQPLVLGGKRYVVPGGTRIAIDTPAAGRNPKYWPLTVGSDATPEEIEKDLDSFRPERWLLDPSSSTKSQTHQTSTDNDADDVSAEASPNLFRPVRGAFLPFSDGFRSCLGRRFAQVEVLAVFAVLFKNHSLELGTDGFASFEEVNSMNDKDKRAVWEKARKEVQRLFKEGMSPRLTLQLTEGKVPLRWVRRGGERFDYRDV